MSGDLKKSSRTNKKGIAFCMISFLFPFVFTSNKLDTSSVVNCGMNWYNSHVGSMILNAFYMIWLKTFPLIGLS